MPKVPTTLSIDAEVKAKVQTLFAELGLDLSTAVNLFFRRCLMENGIPFDVALPRAVFPAHAETAETAASAASAASFGAATPADLPEIVTAAATPAAVATAEDETVDTVARRILREHRAAFEALAK